MHQSVSDPTNLPNLLWRFAACCGSYNYHGHGDADSSASRSNASGGVTAPSVFIRGAGSEHRIQKREISPLKWNMELWFVWKGATVWVTSVNTHLPWGVLSLKLLPGSVLPGTEVRNRWLKRSATVTLIRCWLTHCWLVGFSRRQVWVFFFNDKQSRRSWWAVLS